ncbi:scavenger receptor class F member 1-like [Haliotis cracherodii]|uniref:scavenger receptor class F member 1-like n=1 Tax=Haliotis cracherodii TaxID=6455 RepID=UPI0039EA36D9
MNQEQTIKTPKSGDTQRIDAVVTAQHNNMHKFQVCIFRFQVHYGIVFWIIVVACMADSTQGAGCTGGQHCSDCDTAGKCSQDCDKGYFGLKCRSLCSTTCRYNTCTLVADRGIGRCTYGCVPGFQGTICDRPCDQVVNCILCQGGCDGGYCQLGGACFAGCRDSFYGAGCKTCPSRCRTCNRMTGVCDECDPTHHGVNCEKSCENCAGSCESSCECVPGFYGDFCAETCSKTCRPKSVHKCLPFPGMTSDNCTGECQKHSAECLHGCVDGWFGPTCSSPCNPGCQHQRCNAESSCAEGCERHHFGPACEPCPENCVNQTCDSNNGSCVAGCRDGLYGEHCNETCTLCPLGVCDQHTGICVTDCNVTQEGRQVNCTQPCSPPECSTGYRNSSLPKWRHISTTTLTSVVCAVVFFVLVACSVCRVCFRKGPCFQRANPSDTGTRNNVLEQADAAYMEYQVLHHYWEIREDAAEFGEEIRNQNHESSSDTSDAAMHVLADYFPGDAGDIGIEARGNAIEDDDDIEAEDADIEAGDDDIEASDVDIEARDDADIEAGNDADIEAGNDADIEAGDDADIEAGDDADMEAGDDDDTDAGDGTSDSSVTENHSYTRLMGDVFAAGRREVVTYISPVED